MLKQNQFDSIVIGAGMSGGWAAKEFCEDHRIEFKVVTEKELGIR